jgi:hypothetical protein
MAEPELPERAQLSCKSERIAPVSHVTAFSGLIKVEHRCEACETAFWFVRERVPGVPPPPLG